MASRSIKKLMPEMAEKAQQVQRYCEVRGVSLLIYCTLRSLEEQAQLYRQSRSYAQIVEKMNSLRGRGFGYLADIIEKVGPQHGPHVTNAAPGESWHNYAEAFDAVPLRAGKAMWQYKGNEKLWDTYAQALHEAGLNWAGNWKSFQELPHAQLREGGNPLRHFSPDGIRKILETNKLL